MKNNKVLYMVNVPAPYMVNYFNELGKLCDLTVIFEKDTSTERDDSWKKYAFDNFTGIILEGKETAPDAAFSPEIIKLLRKTAKDYAHIFISNMATPTGIMAVLWLRRHHIPYYLESEGGFAGSGRGLKEKIKYFVMHGATKYFSTTPIGDDYFRMYGARDDQFVKYPFTSLYDADIMAAPASRDEKSKLRKELNVPESKMIIAVGRFVECKGFDLLLDAARQIDSSAGIYFVGGKPTEEYLALVEKYNLKNVHFVGFLDKDSLNKYYRAADFFVLPTRGESWGLVINESMAQGLPVITTDRCIAGVELVQDDVNGYIIPVETVDPLADAMNKLLALSDESLAKMGQESINRIRWYTFESMAKVHADWMKI